MAVLLTYPVVNIYIYIYIFHRLHSMYDNHNKKLLRHVFSRRVSYYEKTVEIYETVTI